MNWPLKLHTIFGILHKSKINWIFYQLTGYINVYFFMQLADLNVTLVFIYGSCHPIKMCSTSVHSIEFNSISDIVKMSTNSSFLALKVLKAHLHRISALLTLVCIRCSHSYISTAVHEKYAHSQWFAMMWVLTTKNTLKIIDKKMIDAIILYVYNHNTRGNYSFTTMLFAVECDLFSEC